MGEKKNEGDNKKGGENNDGGNKKKNETASVTVVLKVDMHCEGCASRIVKCVRSFQGVETVKSESATGKLTVTGALDPAKLREKLEEKTKKKVDLVSPQPKKEKDKDNKNKNDDDNKNKPEEKKKADNNNEKKPKETPVTTAVLKLNFHCQGCIGKIQKTVTKTKGVNGLTMDKEKNLVTVKGTMDVKKLVESLSEKLKRPVEIVPPKKDKENGNEAGEKKKGGGGGGGDDGGGKEKSGNKGGGEGVNMMEYMAAQPAYGYGYYPGGPYGYPIQAHAPQIFSDENPNACVVM
ncbi:PREDICTED: heavy metal-associated isoprenylated plant protein 3 [Camelina sativa]|uniref:Heavy metal-associated isoprenylated plant protein 3 n=1 Tax=Camelina sativa TaxID=90675 RepID=A0ABM0UNU1_CAMSA|nr:PREDICTED: heavy metal-associated isoprenylated plant protein 3 [Camelina sativa]